MCGCSCSHFPQEPQTINNWPRHKTRAEGNDCEEASGTNPGPRVSDAVAARAL